MGALPTPGRRCPPDQRSLSGRRLPLPSGQPYTPLEPPTCGAADNGAYEDSLAFTRPAFPSPVTPGWNGSPSAFSWASHPAVTRDARQDKDGPHRTLDRITPSSYDYLQTVRSLTACDLTSHDCPQLHRPAATGPRRNPSTSARPCSASWRTGRSHTPASSTPGYAETARHGESICRWGCRRDPRVFKDSADRRGTDPVTELE